MVVGFDEKKMVRAVQMARFKACSRVLSRNSLLGVASFRPPDLKKVIFKTERRIFF